LAGSRLVIEINYLTYSENSAHTVTENVFDFGSPNKEKSSG